MKHRRVNALARLELQLSSGVKNTKEGPTLLTDSDIKRIKKEVEVLKAKVL